MGVQSKRRGRRGRASIALAPGLATLALIVAPQPAAAATCGDEEPRIVGSTYYGTACDDVFRAPRSVTVIYGEGGDDTLYGQRGNDRLFGGPGNDRLYGGIGDDQLRGGPGNDLLSGGFGADSALDGEAGDDFVRGDATIDKIQNTGGGIDTLSYATGVTPGFFERTGTSEYPATNAFAGLPGRDGRGAYVNLLTGLGDNGLAPAGGGVDLEVEAADFEIVIGTAFPDFIVGTAEAQTIYGGGGADVILGKGGEDQIFGGEEGDYCETAAGTTLHECEFSEGETEVEPRDPGTVRSGRMAPSEPAALYLTGSDGDDAVVATYSAAGPAGLLHGRRQPGRHLPAHRASRLAGPGRPGRGRHARRQRLSGDDLGRPARRGRRRRPDRGRHRRRPGRRTRRRFGAGRRRRRRGAQQRGRRRPPRRLRRGPLRLRRDLRGRPARRGPGPRQRQLGELQGRGHLDRHGRRRRRPGRRRRPPRLRGQLRRPSWRR